MTDRHDDGASASGSGNVPAAGIDDEALNWVIRMSEPDADWDAFMAWMEADPRRVNRYDHAAAALRDAEDLVALVPTAPAPRPLSMDVIAKRRPRLRPAHWIGGMLAVAIAGSIGFGAWTHRPKPYDVETPAGEQRTIALEDGSSIVLAAASKVRLDHSDARTAIVEHGEMLFRVRHSSTRPFTVHVGGLKLQDLGTVFDVKTVDGRTRVAVSEGAVMIDPEGAAMRLDPGQGVLAEASTLERQNVQATDVGSWREGRLAYDGATLAEVASDISRQLGTRVSAAPAIAKRQFRGTLDAQAFAGRPALLGSLLGVEVRQDPSGWTLEPHQ